MNGARPRSDRNAVRRIGVRLAVVGAIVVAIVGAGQLLGIGGRPDSAAATAGSSGIAAGPGGAVGASPAEGTVPPGSLAPTSAGPSPTAAATSCVGAAAIVRGFTACPQDPAATMHPSPLAASGDRSDAYRNGCWSYAPFTARPTCRFGTGRIRVALVGNSHAGQWLPTLQALAKRLGWTVTTFLASRCNATDAKLEFYSATTDADCTAWGAWALRRTSGDAFDLVVTSERQSVRVLGQDWPGTYPAAQASYTTFLTRWAATGANILILRDTPLPGHTLSSVPGCLAAHPTDQPACSGTPQSWASTDPLYAAAEALALPDVTLLDPTPFLCTETVCPAVIGSVVAYFDASHMTATYARSIAPFVQPTFIAALARTESASPSP